MNTNVQVKPTDAKVRVKAWHSFLDYEDLHKQFVVC